MSGNMNRPNHNRVLNPKIKNKNISNSVSKAPNEIINNKVSDLLVNLCTFSNSVNDNPTYSDDELFEDIAINKNITFGRSRTYFDNEFPLYPVTPIRPNLNSQEKENQQLVCMPSSLKKGLSSRKNSPSKTPDGKLRRNTSSKESKAFNTSPVFSLHLSNSTRKSQTSPENSATPKTNDLGSIRSFETGLDVSNNLGATSTPSNSSSELSKNANQSLTKILPQTCSSPLNSLLFQNSFTPKTKIVTQIPSMKQYTLMKAAMSARKDFENIVRSAKEAKLRKSGGKLNKNYLNTTPEVERANCSPSLRNTPSTLLDSSTSIQDGRLNNTPQSSKEGGNSRVKFTGIKQLPVVDLSITKEKDSHISLIHKNRNNSQNIAMRQIEDYDDDDLPATQPVTSILLRGIVAYVEVKSGKEYRSSGTKAELESLGAKVENNFTKKVTHCFFHGGKMSTYRRAIEWNVPLVSTLWIEACKEELRVVPLEGFEPYGIEKYKEELPLYRLKTRIRRPVTDSKLPAKPWKPPSKSDKAIQVADIKRGPLLVSNIQSNKVIEALHSVAGDIKKASDQFEQILTSPKLLKASKQQNDSSKHTSKDRGHRKKISNSKKTSKKLIFSGSSEDEQTKTSENNYPANRNSNELDNEIRVSYDSDDMLVYAKKQAANARCSAPPRLLTSRKCKKLLSSCNKKQTTRENNDNSKVATVSKPKENEQVVTNCVAAKPLTNTQQSPKQQSSINTTENRPKPRKRKLLSQAQTIQGFKQDSRESTPDLSYECPYKVTPNKKQKTGAKNKMAKPVVKAPLSIDCDSDDSLTRAARRESSALFVKKQKNINSQRNIPTIVCTSLHRRDVEVVASIVSTLGKFVVEGSVSERTTHLITSSPRRTINLLKGIARGCWILNIKWVYESLESGKWLHEERFELLEFSPSVRQARVERQAFGPEFSLELFQGVGPIYVCRTTSPPANDLMELIRLCGGVVVSSARAAKIVIGSTLPFSPTGSHPLMVKEKWILDSISQLRQLNPHNYISIVPEP